jgi:hypothetical protein
MANKDNIDFQAGCAQPLPGKSLLEKEVHAEAQRGRGRRVISESMFKL